MHFFGLNVFLCILLFLMALQMELFSSFHFQIAHYSVFFCIDLITFQNFFITANNLCVCVCVYFLRFSVDKVVLPMNRDRLTSIFQSGCLVFLFHGQLPWLQLPVQCYIEVARVDILVLFLTLGEKDAVFHH